MEITEVLANDMRIPKPSSIIMLLDRLLGVEKAERKTTIIKEDANNRIDEISNTLEKTGKLQNRVIQKTTTYYLGKGMGVIK